MSHWSRWVGQHGPKAWANLSVLETPEHRKQSESEVLHKWKQMNEWHYINSKTITSQKFSGILRHLPLLLLLVWPVAWLTKTAEGKSNRKVNGLVQILFPFYNKLLKISVIGHCGYCKFKIKLKLHLNFQATCVKQ